MKRWLIRNRDVGPNELDSSDETEFEDFKTARSMEQGERSLLFKWENSEHGAVRAVSTT